jgi:hypothetical protein
MLCGKDPKKAGPTFEAGAKLLRGLIMAFARRREQRQQVVE